MPEEVKVPKHLSKHEARSMATKLKICNAAINCLDKYGYSETSFVKIEREANVSRGALMHHFQNRTQIMASAAMMLLDNSLKPVNKRDANDDTNQSIKLLINESWDRVVNTKGGRALLEILVACRTDNELHEYLSDKLVEWDKESISSIASVLRHRVKNEEDIRIIWSIWRSFVRGLIVHHQFLQEPEYSRKIVNSFAEMVELYLLPIDKSV